ncbi:MAG: replication initiation protein [Acetobacteraceae bacterium]|nr:replication initiation protein [Acetobacteraceae bacterium]
MTQVADELEVAPRKPARKVVVQHNALAEAQYRLSMRAQKLLIRLLAELDNRNDDFVDIKLHLRDFARLASGDPGDVLFTEFADAAKQFMGRYLSITQPPVEGEEESRVLICHWISSIEKNPNERSITFSFDKKLKPYLLGLKRDFFGFRTLHALNLDSAYAIRLYQWAKSREYLRRPQQVAVEDLRCFLGTMEIDGEGRVIRESLKPYGDFKRVALGPAVKEVNAKTDLTLAFQEVKKPGTKTVASVLFRISLKEGAESSPAPLAAETPAPARLALGERPADGEAEALFASLKAGYGLNERQVGRLRAYAERHGLPYVKEKVAITEREPRRNAARFLLAALRDDFKMPVRTAAKKKKAAVSERPTEETAPDGEAARQEMVERLRAFRTSGLAATAS